MAIFSRSLFLILSLAVGLAGVSLMSRGQSDDAPKAKSRAADPYDDALPEGASARFGTSRRRVLARSIQFTPDGKQLIGVDLGRRIHIWDAGTGRLLDTRVLQGRPERDAWSVSNALSADGKTVLICERDVVELWDVPSGKRLNLPLPKSRKPFTQFAVTNDRDRIFWIESIHVNVASNTDGHRKFAIKQNLLCWDTEKESLRLLAENDPGFGDLSLSPDGKLLAASSGQNGMRVWEAQTAKLLWQDAGAKTGMLAFTQDGRFLISSGQGRDAPWRMWEAATGKRVTDFHQPKENDTGRFSVSPDGRKLLFALTREYVLWDLKAGKEICRVFGSQQEGRSLFAADGKSFVTYRTVIDRWDAATGKPVYDDVASLGHTAPVVSVTFTPDGKRLGSFGYDQTLRQWDRATGRQLTALKLPFINFFTLAWTPDGTTLLFVTDAIKRWSLTEKRQLDGFRVGDSAKQAHVMSDGKTLAVLHRNSRKRAFSFWDLETGKLRRWGAPHRNFDSGDRASLCPDGRYASQSGKLFDTSTGQDLDLEQPPGARFHHDSWPRFSPDSRLLTTVLLDSTGTVGVWEVASGRLLRCLPEASHTRAAFSPNNRLLAFVAGTQLIVVDLRTGKTIFKRESPNPHHYYWLSANLAFSPEGRTLATGCADGTILLWDVPAVPKGEPLTQRETQQLWDDLQSVEPVRAWAAIWRFQEDPEQAVQVLADRYAPGPVPAQGELKRLVRQLNSDRYQEREAAARRLQDAGRAAEESLRDALKQDIPLEQKRRIESLLGRLLPSHSWPRGEALRAARAAAILEGCNTRAARQLLQEWSRRDPKALDGPGFREATK